MIGLVSALLATTAGQPSLLDPIATHAVKIDQPIAHSNQPSAVRPREPVVILPPPSPPSPPPPPPLPNPSGPARHLAERLIGGAERFRPNLVATARRNLLNPWWRGGGSACDPDNTECARIADQIAERSASATLTRFTEVFGRVLGAHFDRTLTAQQIGEATRFAESPAGSAFLRSLYRLDEIGREGFEALAPSFGPDRAAQREFDERTRDLPRAPAPVLPVPPSPPPPPAEPRK